MKQKILVVIFILSFFTVKASNYNSVKLLAQRRVPWLASQLLLLPVEKENGKDVFLLSTQKNKLVIKASSTSAAASGLNYYLENYCYRSMSHLGDNLSPVKNLPQIKTPIKVELQFPIRYALNYCTINYTMSFYQWTDWEKELDWMALHGVNLMLAPAGTEKIWQNTLKKFGYSDKEILDYLPGPAFTAWWLMGNLQGWGGPVSQNFIDNQVILQKKILSRMNELGIEPVLQGFYGMIPSNLKEKLHASVAEQGKWADFKRPDILNPASNLFEDMAATYYEEIKLIYGNNIKYFGGDLFHEGGNTGELNVPESGKAVQDMMLKSFPLSSWVLQGWSGNPKAELLQKLNKSNVLILDLFGENQDNWFKTRSYDNIPFVWCTISNFGEQVSLYGKLQHLADEVYRAKNSVYSKYMYGVGVMPEGINNNPAVYDLVLSLSFTNNKVNVSEWIKKYIQYRYGTFNQSIYDAWLIFLQTAYYSNEKQEGLPESFFCARPGVDVKSASTWGSGKRYYDLELFKKGVRLFLSAENKFATSETYQVDKVDFLRQVIANNGSVAYEKMNDAIKDKNLSAFKNQSAIFLNYLLLQDSLLSTNKYFKLSTWLLQAEKIGARDSDKKLAIKNAKMQITIWGPDWDPKTTIRDYAAKEWSGLLKSFYYPRWKMFAEEQTALLDGRTTKSVDYFSFEKKWAESEQILPEVTLTSFEKSRLIKSILK